MNRVAVIGGGFAGLTAAVALADRGCVVHVLEARPHLGGRAYSFRDAATGVPIDNGQHALMGCYARTLSFLERIGASRELVRQSNMEVSLVDPRLGRGTIRFPPLPGPLHALAGVLRYRLLARLERMRALAAGIAILALRRRRDPRLLTLTIEELLVRLGQSDGARRRFWHPIAIATCNESPERAAAGPFAEVMARAFFGSRADSQFVFSRVGLSELYVDRAARVVTESGGRIEPHATVTDLEIRDGRVVALLLRDGRRLEVDACVAALPPQALARLVGERLADHPGFGRLGELGCSPIVSAHLWFDRPVLDDPFVGLIGRTAQWVFDRERLAGVHRCVSAVVSASRELVERDTESIAAAITADLRELLPGARHAVLEHAIVVKEKHATASVTPETTALRLPPATALPNLLLAGDWTDTGLPPTIESAVVSGERAAFLAAGYLGGH